MSLDQLITAHPELFKQVKALECHDGWIPLIKQLCEEIELLKGEIDVHFTQIKEKWGLLRIYVNSAPDEIYKLLNSYEIKSGTICEVCGEPGIRRKGGWISTLCDAHNGTDDLECDKLP
jgi:hypothetical protein